MVALALLSILLYQAIIGLYVFVRRVSGREIKNGGGETRFSDRHLIGVQSEEEVHRQQLAVIDETLWQFRQLVRSRLKFSHTLLAAAPLLGLLGTVMGMLDTFHGMSLQLGQETSRAVADGISRALITTQTGLMVAIPALFILHWIKREIERHELRIMEHKMQLLSQPHP